MMKQLWLSAVCLFCAPLAALTVGNVEFQFPPSNYEWKLLADQNFFLPLGEDTEEEEFKTDLETEKNDLNNTEFRIFTHREGDALELFSVMIYKDEDDSEDDDEKDTLESVQKMFNEGFNQFFPNHKLIVQSLVDEKEQGFFEWELNDGNQDILHGISKAFIHINSEGLKSITLLSYMTTALQSEYNRILWSDSLNQAKFLD